MQIDNKLNLKARIVQLESKLCKAISIIYRCSSLVNEQALRALYCSSFLSQLTYCCEVWGTIYNNNLNCLYILQKKSIKINCKAEKLVHTTALFLNQTLLRFEDIAKHNFCGLVFKASKNNLPKNLQNESYFTLDQHAYNLSTICKPSQM